MSPLSIKEELYAHCEAYVTALLERAEEGIRASQEEASREQKSSAGDKFETHRAMMHLQMESYIKRQEVAEGLMAALQRLSLQSGALIQAGSLVGTDQGFYFISISAPALSLEGDRYLCLSPDAPLARAMLGAQAGDWVEWSVGEEERELEVFWVC